MTSTKKILSAGLFALSIAALSAPAFAQGTGAASGGPSNSPTGSNLNDQATPGTAATGGTYPVQRQDRSGTTGSGTPSNPNMSQGADGKVGPADSVGTGGPTNSPTGR